MSVCCDCCVLSGRGLCDGLVTRLEEFYLYMRVLFSVIRCNNNLLRQQWVGGRDQNQKEKINKEKYYVDFRVYLVSSY
jgi:hypothetical protein